MKRKLGSVVGMLASCAIIAGCGSQYVSESELAKKRADLDQRNIAAKEEAERKKREELGVTSMLASIILHDTDPFPKSVYVSEPAIYPAEYVVVNRYLKFVGWDGPHTFYETYAGSKLYFLVDAVLQQNGSASGWHVTASNGVIRGVFKPTIITEKVKVRGCRPGQTEVDIGGGDVAYAAGMQVSPPSYGIFMLPKDVKPSLYDDFFHKDTGFEIEWEDHQLDVEYVPNDGKGCFQSPYPM